MSVDDDLDKLFGSDSEEDKPEQTQAQTESREESDTEQRETRANSPTYRYSNSPSPFQETVGETFEQTTTYEIPELEQIQSHGAQVFYSKLPSFLSVEPKPLDLNTFRHKSLFEDTEEFLEDDFEISEQQQEEFNHKVTQFVENTIRWKYIKDEQNNVVGKESNARLVRWSDNSFSLLIGEELFDVFTKPLDKQYHYLISQYPQEQLLQAQARLRNSMLFRSYSTKDITKRTAIKQKLKKSIKTKTFTPEVHPDIELMEIEKNENERVRAQRKLEAKRRNEAAKFSRSLTEDVLEQGDEEDFGREPRVETALDEYDEDFINDDASEDGSGLDDDIDDDEMDARINRAKVSTSDDENPAKKRKRSVSEDSMSAEEEEEALQKATNPGKRRIIDDSDDED